jgi:hypothetical protein
MTTLLLTFGCCCACPGYFLKPMWDQYPASASLPTEAAGLTLRDDAASETTVRKLRDEVGTKHLFAEDVFAGVYSGGGNRVTVFGSTGFRLTPKSDLDGDFVDLTERFGLADTRDVDAGTPGGYLRCAVGEAEGDDLILCAWADHGSLGVATFSAGSMANSAELVRELRTSLIARG